jgi:hypothetical protein
MLMLFHAPLPLAPRRRLFSLRSPTPRFTPFFIVCASAMRDILIDAISPVFTLFSFRHALRIIFRGHYAAD